jgi:hypothetical protein|tara:strand:+ start:785 stop:1984 length:1200 start_codon:yes stop_codon:yes gene_type:complete
MIPSELTKNSIQNKIVDTISNSKNKIKNALSNPLVGTLKENISQYKNIISLLVGLFIFILISYFISENYRINLVLTDMQIYNSIIVVNNSNFKDDHKLADYYIASSFRSVLGKNQRFDYCSTRILKKILKEGARFIWLDVFNSDLSFKPKPIVCNGVGKGNWQLTLNSLTFDECCQTIAETAFTSGNVNNYDDPLFLALNLNTQGNLYSLNKIKKSIIKHLGDRLLEVHYGFNRVNMGSVPMSKLKKKVIIFTSDGFQDSSLEELINYSWDNKNMKKLIYQSIDPNVKITEYVKENIDSLKNFNTNNITIVTPDPNTLFTRQYEPSYAWDYGCQFVSMYYQSIDKKIEKNVKKFKNKSFILKPPNLRTPSYEKPNLLQEQKSANISNNETDLIVNQCPL